MNCGDIMQKPARTVRDENDALVAASLMRDQRVGFLPVCDASGRIVGIVTERDLALRVCAENETAKEVAVRDIMTLDPITCRPGQPVADAERQMRSHRHSVIAVVDDRDHPVGVISLWDIYDFEQYEGDRPRPSTARSAAPPIHR